MKYKTWIPFLLYALVMVVVIIFDDYFRQPIVRQVISILASVSFILIVGMLLRKVIYRNKNQA